MSSTMQTNSSDGTWSNPSSELRLLPSHRRHDRLVRSMTWTLLGMIALLLFLLIWPEFALSQDMRYIPKSPLSIPGEAKLPDEPSEVGGSTTILVDELKGLIFVDDKEKVVLGKLNFQGIDVDGELRLVKSSAFRKMVAKYLGGPVSIHRLNELSRDVVLFYRRNDRPVVDVSIPEQDITDGVVQVVVTEARIGEVKFEGARHFDTSLLDRKLCIHPGQRISEMQLLEELRWLNQNPFREIDLTLQPGSEFGETDVVFQVNDDHPVRFYTGYEDTGTRETDLERLIFGVNWGNALWRDHIFSYQYTASPDFRKVQSHSAIYSIPMIHRDQLLMYGSYATIEPAVLPFTNSGLAWQSGFLYHKRLRPRIYNKETRYEHRLVGGFEFTQTNTDLDFGGTDVADYDADIAQMVFGYHGVKYEPCGSWALGGDLYISPGGFSRYNRDVFLQQLRAGARADYIYSRMYLERYRDIFDGGLKSRIRLTGQVSDANLIPSEQLGFGGYNSVRGYDWRLVNGDAGYILNCEILTDPVSLGLNRWCCHEREDKLQFLWFFDHGIAMYHTLTHNQRQRLNGERPQYDLYSTGIGMRYMMRPNINIRFDYGWQLADHVPNDTVSSRPHVSIIVAR